MMSIVNNSLYPESQKPLTIFGEEISFSPSTLYPDIRSSTSCNCSTLLSSSSCQCDLHMSSVNSCSCHDATSLSHIHCKDNKADIAYINPVRTRFPFDEHSGTNITLNDNDNTTDCRLYITDADFALGQDFETFEEKSTIECFPEIKESSSFEYQPSTSVSVAMETKQEAGRKDSRVSFIASDITDNVDLQDKQEISPSNESPNNESSNETLNYFKKEKHDVTNVLYKIKRLDTKRRMSVTITNSSSSISQPKQKKYKILFAHILKYLLSFLTIVLIGVTVTVVVVLHES